MRQLWLASNNASHNMSGLTSFVPYAIFTIILWDTLIPLGRGGGAHAVQLKVTDTTLSMLYHNADVSVSVQEMITTRCPCHILPGPCQYCWRRASQQTASLFCISRSAGQTSVQWMNNVAPSLEACPINLPAARINNLGRWGNFIWGWRSQEQNAH